MKIMVSACLAGENCKYNGGSNRNRKVLQLMEENEVITVCPEQMGGLPTPRVPSEIRNGVVTAKDGRVVDAEFRAGAAKCLEIAMREQPDLIVLQSRSPSCGVKQRYDGTFSGTLVDGAGVTAQLLMENGFRVIDVEDLAEICHGVLIRKLHHSVLIRKLLPEETYLLKDFLYEAIFIPEGMEPPDRTIVERPYGHVDDETPSFAISLLPEYRGQGIGTCLMKEMLSLLKDHGYRQASLAVQKANYAVRMYRSVGFEISGENGEEYIMVCRL